MLVLSYWVFHAKIGIPWLPGSFTGSDLIQLYVIGWAVLHTALLREPLNKRVDNIIILLFSLNMIFILAVRGGGISLFGGSTYGGASYLYLFIILFFYIAAQKISLNEKQLKLLFYGGLICSLVPLSVQASVFVSGGATSFLLKYIDITTQTISSALMKGRGADAMRWNEALPLAQSLLLVAFVLPGLQRKKFVAWVLIAMALGLVFFTGYRGRLVKYGLLVFIWLIYDSNNRKATFLWLVTFGLIGWILIIALAPILPWSVQRTVSFLPFVSDRIVGSESLMSAQSSVDFRMEIWKMCWDHLPQYLLIGRGLAVNITPFAWLSSWWYSTPEFLYHMRGYHSGVFSLLIDFGVFGFVAMTSALVAILVRGWKSIKRLGVDRSNLLDRFFAFSVVLYTVEVFHYYFIMGNFSRDIPEIIFPAVLIQAIGSTLAKRQSALEKTFAIDELEGKA
jgi:O-antigen ligase